MPFRFLCLAVWRLLTFLHVIIHLNVSRFVLFGADPLLTMQAVIAFVAASPRVTLEGDITAPSSWSLEGPAAAEMETSVYFFLKVSPHSSMNFSF